MLNYQRNSFLVGSLDQNLSQFFILIAFKRLDEGETSRGFSPIFDEAHMGFISQPIDPLNPIFSLLKHA
jgi:hypothetical protein